MIEVRYTMFDDAVYLKQWLSEPGILDRFSMGTPQEMEDAIRYWIGFSKLHSSLTALYEGIPCGIATLCLFPYKKIAHQSLLSLIVDSKLRNQGIGTLLLEHLFHLAQNQFHLEALYLEVYEDNPAVNLYHRCGFEQVAFQKYFMKNNGVYVGKIVMEKKL